MACVGYASHRALSRVDRVTFDMPRDGKYAIWGRSFRERLEDETVGRVQADLLDVYFDLCLDDQEIEWSAFAFLTEVGHG